MSRPQFLNIPQDVAARSDLTPTAKLIFGYLNAFSQAGLEAYPAVSIIAAHTGVSVRAVYDALKALQAATLLRVHRRLTDNGKTTSSVYENLWAKARISRLGPPPELTENRGAKSAKPGVQNPQGEGADSAYKEKALKRNTTPPLTPQATTPPPSPPPQPAGEKRACESVALALVKRWDERFPKTCPGSDRVADQGAFLRLMTQHDKTPQNIEAYMDYIDTTGSLRYWTRPARLMRHTDQGNGEYRFVNLDMRMEAEAQQQQADRTQAGPTADETLAKLRQAALR